MPATLKQPVQNLSTPMNSIRVYNTLTREKETFEPLAPGKVGIYLCGPTVYNEAHIGHMVGPVIFDTIKRYLDLLRLRGDLGCQYYRRRRQADRPVQAAWHSHVANCHRDDDGLLAQLVGVGSRSNSTMPKATEHMGEIISFIEDLVQQGFAYEADGDVFFDVNRSADYGKLSNRSADSQQGEGGEAAGKKRSPGDFALWKSAKPGEPTWDSPWGKGRPGWHIECSAMSRRLLGETFDIHGGGLDLIFPHHENEVAQSECCHGKPMAKYWMHNGLLRAGEAGKVGGRSDRQPADESSEASSAGKMSRSKGAGGLRGLIERQGGERIRFFLLRTHYRSTIVFSEEGVAEAGTALDKFYQLFDRYQRMTGQPYYLQADDTRKLVTRRAEGDARATQPLPQGVAGFRESFLSKMDDDFNTGAAVSDLFQILTALNKFADQHQLDDSKRRTSEDLALFTAGVEVLRELSSILGLFQKPAHPSQRRSAD